MRLRTKRRVFSTVLERLLENNGFPHVKYCAKRFHATAVGRKVPARPGTSAASNSRALRVDTERIYLKLVVFSISLAGLVIALHQVLRRTAASLPNEVVVGVFDETRLVLPLSARGSREGEMALAATICLWRL